MTPLLAAPLLVAVSCLALSAQDAEPPVTALEGEWREPLRPGEEAADKCHVTCSGAKIIVRFNGQLVQGTFETEPGSEPPAISIAVMAVNGRALAEKRVYSGSYCVEEGHLYLRIDPFSSPDLGAQVELPPIEWEKDPERLMKQLQALVAQIEAEAAEARRGRPLGLAPITFRLEKVKQ